MNFVSKIALGILATGALGGLYYWDLKRSEKQEEAKLQENRALPFQTAEATHISLQSPKGNLVLQRENKDANWKFSTPQTTVGVDQDSVKSFLDQVNTLDLMQEIPSTEKAVKGDEAARREYGLATPAATFQVTLANGTKHSLSIGSDLSIGKDANAEAAKGMAVYALSSSRNNVILLSSSNTGTFEKSFADFRTKAVATFKTADVAFFDIVRASGDNLSVAKVDGKWMIRKPRELVGDESGITLYLDRMASLKADEVQEAAAADRNKLGLAPAQATLVLRDKDQKELQRIEMGKETDARFAVTMADGGIGILTSRKWDELAPELKSFRDRRVLRDVAMAEVRKIVTASGKTFERDAKDWYPVGGKAVEIPLPKLTPVANATPNVAATPTEPKKEANRDVGDFFSDFEFLTADDIIDDARTKDLAAFGLDKPQTEFTFIPAEGKGEPVRILVGKKVPNDDKLIYIKRANQDAVFAVEKYWLETLKKFEPIAESENAMTSGGKPKE